jgi:YVTN family beta-propeller protein
VQYVASTLDLCSNTVYPGNHFPGDCAGDNPIGVAYDSGKSEYFVANSNSYNVSAVNDRSNKIVANIPVGIWPNELAYDSGKGEIFVTNSGSSNVSVINDSTNGVVANIPVGSEPQGITYDSGQGEVFVANYVTPGNVAVINDTTNRVIANISIGDQPQGMAYDAARGQILVATNAGLSEIADTNNTVVANVTMPGNVNVYALSYDTAKDEAFVSSTFENEVYVVNVSTNIVVASILVGTQPQGVAYDSRDGEIMVTNVQSDNETVISDVTNSVVGAVALGSIPQEVAYDSGNGLIFVTNGGLGTVSIISFTNVTSVSITPPSNTIPIGQMANFTATPACVGKSCPSGLGYAWNLTTPSAGSLNSSTGNPVMLTALDENVRVGLFVNVTLNGVAQQESESIITMTTVSIASVSVAPSNATMGVQGVRIFTANPKCGIACPPSGISYYWSLTNSAMGSISQYRTGVVEFMSAGAAGKVGLFVNATFSLNSVQGMAMITILNLTAVTVSPPSAAVGVGGVTAPFKATPVCQATCPAGTTYTWSMTRPSMGSLNTSSGNSVQFRAGSMPGTIGIFVNATLNGTTRESAPVIVTISPQAGTGYFVTFTETGLQTGTGWTVAFGPTYNSSSTNTIIFKATNGTYPFLVNPVSGYTFIPTTGNITVDGAPVVQPVTFTSVSGSLYPVNFTESGLASGTLWSVGLGQGGHNETTLDSSGPVIGFAEPNGTYYYEVGAVPGFTANPLDGSFQVSGGPVSEPIGFTKLPAGEYSVIFSERGLPKGTSWSVTLNNSPANSQTGNISFAEPNGTYSYSVGQVNGYTASPPSGGFAVRGSSVVLAIKFASLPGGTYAVTFTEWGLPAATNWSISFAGSTQFSVGDNMVFTSGNGSFGYSVGDVPGYSASPSKGNVSVTGNPVSVPAINFVTSQTTTLNYVNLNTQSVNVPTDGWQDFVAMATCSPGPCPSRVSYTWVLSNPGLGQLNTTGGSVVRFTAGSSDGTDTLTVVAGLNGQFVYRNATITIGTSSSGTNSTTSPKLFSGASGFMLLVIVVVIVVVVAIVIALLLVRRRNQGEAMDYEEPAPISAVQQPAPAQYRPAQGSGTPPAQPYASPASPPGAPPLAPATAQQPVPTPKPVFCESCGAPMTATGKFCHTCGAKVET